VIRLSPHTSLFRQCSQQSDPDRRPNLGHIVRESQPELFLGVGDELYLAPILPKWRTAQNGIINSISILKVYAFGNGFIYLKVLSLFWVTIQKCIDSGNLCIDMGGVLFQLPRLFTHRMVLFLVSPQDRRSIRVPYGSGEHSQSSICP